VYVGLIIAMSGLYVVFLYMVFMAGTGAFATGLVLGSALGIGLSDGEPRPITMHPAVSFSNVAMATSKIVA
jgi:hypothetical protein